MEELIAQVQPYVVALLVAAAAKYAVDALVYLFKGGVEVIDKFQKWLDQRAFFKDAKIDNLITKRLREAVLIVQDEVVDEMKEHSADGRLTKAEAAVAVEAAYDKFCEVLSETEHEELIRVFGDDLIRLAKARIPAIVQALKLDALLPSMAAPVAEVIDSVVIEDDADPQ